MISAVVLPASFPLVGLGLASTLVLTVCPLIAVSVGVRVG